MRLGFSSYTTNMVYGRNEEKAIKVNIPDFDGGADNIRVTIVQFEPGAGSETTYFKWYVDELDSVTDACKIRIFNETFGIHVLHGAFYLPAGPKINSAGNLLVK